MNYISIARVYEKMGNREESMKYYRKAAGKTASPVMERLITHKITSLASQ